MAHHNFLYRRDARSAKQSRTCIASELSAAPSSSAGTQERTTGAAEIGADPASPVRGEDLGAGVSGTAGMQIPDAGLTLSPARVVQPQQQPGPEQPQPEPERQQPEPQPEQQQQPPEPELEQPPTSTVGPSTATPSPSRSRNVNLILGAEVARLSAAEAQTGISRVPQTTASGQSWGPLGHYAADWNSSECPDMSSSAAAFTESDLPATSPGTVSCHINQARISLYKAGKAAEVKNFSILHRITFIIILLSLVLEVKGE